MSKAQKSIPAAEEKKKFAAKEKASSGGAKAKADAAKRAPAKAAAKASASTSKAPAKKTTPVAKPDKKASKPTAVRDKVPAKAEKPHEKATKKAPAASAKGRSTTTRVDRLSHGAAQAAGEAAVAKLPGFSNGGLGIKTSSKKPGLSIAPGVMILGRAATGKTETPERVSERKLSKKELADIKAVLMEKRERLLAGMRRELAVQRERAESKAADEVDKATDAYDEDLSFEIATANDQELSEIQVALEKIDKGTYGECEICGCTISPSRLKILPSATTCVACRGQEELARRRDDGNLLFSMMSGEEGESESGEI